MTAQNPWIPLTDAAYGIYFAQKLDPENPCYNTAEVLECAPDTDSDLLREALKQVYTENEGFRVRLRTADGTPQQQVLSPEEFLRVVDVLPESTLPAAEVEDEALNGYTLPAPIACWAQQLNSEPLDIDRGQTVRSALLRWKDRLWVFHSFHHLVADGFAAFNSLGRLAAIYRAESQHQQPEEVRRPSLAALLEADRQAEPVRQRDMAFWESNPPVFDQPDTSLAQQTAAPSAQAIRVSLPVSAEIQSMFEQVSKAHGVSWPVAATAAVGSYLARVSGNTRASFGLPQMNRTLDGDAAQLATVSAQTGCTAVNVLPVSVPGYGFGLEHIRQVERQQKRNRQHALARQETLQRMAQRAQGRLFGAQINIVPFDAVLNLGKHTAQLHNISAGPVDDLTVCLRGMVGRGNDIYCELDANPALYTREQIQAHAHRLLNWLYQWAKAVLGRYSTDSLSVCTAAERAELDLFNATDKPLPPRTLLARWQEQVSKNPENPALQADTGHRLDRSLPALEHRLTYRQLDERARDFAAALLAAGAQPGDAIGLRFERGIEQFIALYGLLYAGCVYLPVLPELPQERVTSMLEDARASLLVAGPGVPPFRETTAGARELSWEDLPLGSAEAPSHWPGESVGADETAYILFTSGSTGRPKGVAVSHAALDNRLQWQQHQILVGEGDRVLHKTPISFDVHVWELYWPLQNGAEVVIAAPGGHRDPLYLARLITETKISCLHFVPAMLGILAHSPSARKVLTDSEGSVKSLVCSGEALYTEHVRASYQLFGVYPLNLYGPTEAAIDVTYYETAEAPHRNPVPIGAPVWNTECKIVDAVGQPLPVGLVGELVLGGVQLADGYVNNPEASDKAFYRDRQGRRLYRTGDLALWSSDGKIIYRGRRDSQVKIGGQRLELGEVETVLSAAPGVKAAVALVRTDSAVPVLAAVVEFSGRGELEEVKKFCAQRLPDYMLPSLWGVTDSFELGSSGKINRRALASFEFDRPQESVDLPRTPLEQTLCELFATVLGRASCAPEQNFLLSGGNSLKALELAGAVESRTGFPCNFGTIFGAPTPRQLAEILEGEEQTGAEFAPVLRLRQGQRASTAWIFLPPAGGLGWCYAPYLEFIPEAEAVYALQAEQFTAPETAWAQSLNDLAESFVQRILELGHSRVVVAGWSAGGTCVPLVARGLEQAGIEVANLLILDAYPAEQWHAVAAPGQQESFRALLRMAGIEPAAGTEFTLESTVAALQEAGSALGHLGPDKLEVTLASMRSSASMMRATHTLPYRGRATFVSISHDDQPYLDVRGWFDYVDGKKSTVIRLEGEHPDVVRAPRIAGFFPKVMGEEKGN